MKRYLAETIELGLFLLIYLFPVHSFAQETVEQVLQFEHTVMNIGTLSEDDDPAMYHFKYHNVSKKPIYLSKLTASCGCTVAKYDKKVVQPGEQGEIILVFHPMDQAGDLYREAFIPIFRRSILQLSWHSSVRYCLPLTDGGTILYI